MEERPGGVGVHVGHEEVEVAVAVDVAPGDPHAGAAVDDAGRGRPLAEGAVALVVVEGVLPELVGDVEVGPAVVVVVGPGGGHAPARVADACVPGDVGEGAVAVVAVERAGDAVGGRVVGPRRGRLLVAHAHDVEVEEAVAVVVGDRRHARPAPGRDARRRAHVDEVAAARVVEEPVAAARRGDEEVGPAVVVVVEEDGAGRGGGVGVGQARGGGHVGEGAVAVVAVEDGVRAPGEEHVLAAVAVHVGDRDTGAGADGVRGPAAEETEGGRAVAGVHARDAGRLGHAREARRPAGDQRARRDVLPRDAPPAVALGDAQGRRLLERRAHAVGARAAHEQADAGRVAVGVGGAPGHAVDTQLGFLHRGEERQQALVAGANRLRAAVAVPAARPLLALGMDGVAAVEDEAATGRGCVQPEHGIQIAALQKRRQVAV